MINFLKILSILVFTSALELKAQESNTCNVELDSLSGIEYVVFPDKDPEFPGGTSAMVEFIQRNITLPKDAVCGAGTIYISFIVLSDGTITSVTVIRTFDKEFSKSAITMINEMPKWTPAICNGVNVNSKFVIPITIN
jgi:protein TonB